MKDTLIILKSSFLSDFTYDNGGILFVEKNSKVLINNVTLNNTLAIKDGGSINANEFNKIVIKNI